MKTLIKILPVTAFLILPVVVHAQLVKTRELFLGFGRLIDGLILVVVGVALLAFFWGLARFIFKAGDEKETAAGKRLMQWGLIALFVMVSVWGIIRFVEVELFGTLDKTNPSIPSFLQNR